MITETHFPSRIDQFKKGFEALDVTLLLKNSLSKQDQKKYEFDSDGQGFDNVAFDLDSLENAEPGCRKPLVGVHERTMSAEEFVRSTLHTKNSRPSILEGAGDYYSLDKGQHIQLKTYSTPNTPFKNSKNTSSEKTRSVGSESSSLKEKMNGCLLNVGSNKQSLEGHCVNIICNKSLPSNWKKKTENGSSLSKNEKLATSFTKTMVRVGSVTSDISQPFSQNLNVSSPFKVVISDSGSKCPPLSASQMTENQRAVVDVGRNSRNVVITHSYPSTQSATFAPYVVSALSKVSSVRIVPSPNDTPTPSVIGVSTTPGLSRPPETVHTPLPTSGTSSVKSSHSSRALQAVKRRLTNIKIGGSEGSRPSSSGLQDPLSSRNGSEPQSSSSNTFLGLFQGVGRPNRENVNVDPPKPSDPQKPDPNTVQPVEGGAPPTQPDSPRREERPRRRERRERRRGHRVLRPGPPPNPPGSQLTDVSHEQRVSSSHLPDLLNSHVPPHYVGPNGPRNMGGMMGPVPNVGPPPISLQMPPPHPPGAPMPPLAPFPPAGAPHVSPIRGPIPDNPWVFLSSRRSRGSRRANSLYMGEEEAKSCCGLLVTQAVSIRWFIIMISFVGLCCTVVGTVLGAVKTSNSEYVTITLLMIGVGIVLITVSGIAWHLTSRDAPCRVMLGLAPNDPSRGEGRRFMSRMAPSFGRPHHPYAAMMYPEFQFRPPPPSYQASMQEYRLRLFLLDRHNSNLAPQNFSAVTGVPSPPPTYRLGPFSSRGNGHPPGTLSRESNNSRPPSYRSREGSINQHPDATPLSEDPGGGDETPIHSREPSCLSFLSREGSGRPKSTQDKGSSRRGKYPIEEGTLKCVPEKSSKPTTKNAMDFPSKDDNTVTIVQTTNCSRVIAPESVVVTVPGSEVSSFRNGQSSVGTEISVLAHL